MSVLLLLLKIIGIVLLVILALLILLIVGILFVPYAYRIKGSYHDRPDLTASIYGLGYLVGAGVIVTENGSRMYLRICGIRKFLHSRNKEDKTGNTDTADMASADVMGSQERETGDFSVMNVQTSETASDFRDESEADQKSSIWRRILKRIQSFGESVVRLHEKMRSWITKMKKFFHLLKQTWGNVKQTMQKLKQLITDESHKRAFTRLKTSVGQLLKILMPRRLKLNLEYSTGSPDTTAQLLGILAMFPIGYRNRWNVHPDFTADNAYADAEFDVRGRILGFSLLKLIFGLLLDKDCRKLYNEFKAMKV